MNQEENSKYKWYLFDLGSIIKERALGAKMARNQQNKDSRDYLFESGRLLAFNEVISILQQQADGLCLKEMSYISRILSLIEI